MQENSEILTIKPADLSKLIDRLDKIERIISGGSMQAVADEILTVEEVCKYLKVSQPTIYRYIKHLNLPTQKCGNQRRFRRTEVDEWLFLQKI